MFSGMFNGTSMGLQWGFVGYHGNLMRLSEILLDCERNFMEFGVVCLGFNDV